MSDLKETLGKYSNLLGSVVGAFVPGGSLITTGLMHLFGINTNSEDDLNNAINSDPMAAIKIKQFELEHKDVLAQTAASVRLGAYQREVSVVQATGRRDPILSWLAILFVGGFFIYSFLLFYVHIDTTAHDIVLLIAGQISSMAMMCGSYYFGGMFKTHVPPVGKPVDLPPPAQTR